MALLRVYSEPHQIQHYSTVFSKALLFQVIVYAIIIVVPFFFCHGTRGTTSFNAHHHDAFSIPTVVPHRVLAIYKYVQRATQRPLSQPMDCSGRELFEPLGSVVEHVCWPEPSSPARRDGHPGRHGTNAPIHLLNYQPTYLPTCTPNKWSKGNSNRERRYVPLSVGALLRDVVIFCRNS